ncbi:DUF1707 SHOCT-like domain-containing protein [Salininema proteolyticum]|uniref:DUF1707 domain-containing protein n=1 Tax=Salininema proteolyticum TaxID=1607685 RepID=A0ABV8TWE6_9ACTN
MSEEPRRQGSMRLSHADREKLVQHLQSALEEGYIDLGEFDERASRAHGARTVADVQGLLDDIPTGEVEPLGHDTSLVTPDETVELHAAMGSKKMRGEWVVGRNVKAVSHMGNVTMDFRQARVAYDRVDVEVQSHMGNVTVILPSDWIATESVDAVAGNVTNNCAATKNGERAVKIVNLSGKAHMGNVKIRRERRFLWWRF